MKLTVFYGTETGNAKGLAQKVAKKGEKNGVEVDIVDLASSEVSVLESIDHPFVVIISTWDDGAPPPKCVPFCKALAETDLSLTGKQYTVLALGDTEYPLFCECGKQVDARLSALGAEAVMPRTDLGADFMVSYIGWSKNFWKTMASVYGVKK
ncbi:flavodoxin family protein [Coraliomargarita sp. SDUM461004]|uniref:Flavodoxin family protein n=1 Tax=Thalassobacterium sedimentorum TaxID=3041258 RepID=A0ABU1AF38_9BACT|nr:flavodoxin family protein [Coraliomargarita sp. SDUM461004]MDQ8193427.1 flavodoxin family protein [Coraliomargarita sp. SDUM461004]